MNYCDFNHATPREVRLLPTGGGGNTIVCQTCYYKEMRRRREDTNERGVDNDIPTWESLKVYDPS